MNHSANARLRCVLDRHRLALSSMFFASLTASLAAVLGYFGLLSGVLALGFLFTFGVFLSAAVFSVR